MTLQLLSTKQIPYQEKRSNQVLVQYYRLEESMEEHMKLDEAIAEKKRYTGKNYSDSGFARASRKLESLLRNQALIYPALTHIASDLDQIREYITKIDTYGLPITNPVYHFKNPFSINPYRDELYKALTPFQHWLNAIKPENKEKLRTTPLPPAVVLLNSEKEFILAQPAIKILIDLGNRINISTYSESKSFIGWLKYQFENRYRNSSNLKLIDSKKLDEDQNAGQVKGILVFGQEQHQKLIERDHSFQSAVLSVTVKDDEGLKAKFEFKRQIHRNKETTITAQKNLQKILKTRNPQKNLINLFESLYQKHKPGERPRGYVEPRDFAKAMDQHRGHPDEYAAFEQAKQFIEKGNPIPHSLHEFDKLFHYAPSALGWFVDALIDQSKPAPSRGS